MYLFYYYCFYILVAYPDSFAVLDISCSSLLVFRFHSCKGSDALCQFPECCPACYNAVIRLLFIRAFPLPVLSFFSNAPRCTRDLSSSKSTSISDAPEFRWSSLRYQQTQASSFVSLWTAWDGSLRIQLIGPFRAQRIGQASSQMNLPHDRSRTIPFRQAWLRAGTSACPPEPSFRNRCAGTLPHEYDHRPFTGGISTGGRRLCPCTILGKCHPYMHPIRDGSSLFAASPMNAVTLRIELPKSREYNSGFPCPRPDEYL